MKKKKIDITLEIRKSSNVLTGWGQIAAYLQCSINRAQFYHKKQGLPVRSNGVVRALKTDMDKWAVSNG